MNIALSYECTYAPRSEFLRLLTFALGETQHLSELKKITILDSENGSVSEGSAHPDEVTVWVHDPLVSCYPQATQYLPELMPTFILRSWEEEVLLTLAHELRHVEQFWLQPEVECDADFHSPQSQMMELDAETFGQSVVLKWRGMLKIKQAA